jgi:hypothetical protein
VLNQDLAAPQRRLLVSLARKRAQPGSGSSLAFLQQRTWRYPMASLQTILKSAPFVVVGGVATRLYMPERMTLDIDILVKTEDRPVVYQDLNCAGAVQVGVLSIGGSQWRLAEGENLDVLEADGDWVEAALAQPNYSPDGLPIIALPYLVLMKLAASRVQDLADVSRMVGLAAEDELIAIREAVNLYLPTAREDLESLILLGKLEIGAGR